MPGTYCTQVNKFERGQLFRRHCVGCVHNTAHLGDAELRCRFLEYRAILPAPKTVKLIPDRRPTIRIPTDLRGYGNT